MAGASHEIALKLPALNTTAGQRLLGVFWSGTEDEYTADTVASRRPHRCSSFRSTHPIVHVVNVLLPLRHTTLYCNTLAY